MERRISDENIEVRKNADGHQLAGRAVVYGSLSVDLGGFRERIAPGAFSESVVGGADVRALVDHDAAKIIGRTPNTLSLSEDTRGVNVVIDTPNTQVGRDTIESVRRGDLRQMSFGFRVTDDSWITENGQDIRTVNAGELLDVSVVSFPAYSDTSIAVRSLDRWKKQEQKAMADETATIEKQEPVEATVPTEVEPKATPERRSVPETPTPTATETATHDPAQWRDAKTGKEVRTLTLDQRFADLHKGTEPLSLGRAVRALIVGDWSDAPLEQRALSSTSNPSAGILIPNPMAASVIDKARALNGLIRAGAVTIPMDSGTLKIARVATDPTFETHTENVAFTGSDMTFDAVELVAFTIGTVVKMSRELAADAPNAVSVIEDNLARALAAKIDFFGMQGTGSAQPLGLVNMAGTNTVSVSGILTYGSLLTALLQIEIDNHQPNAVLLSPTNADSLRQALVNSESNHFAAAPPAIASLTQVATSGMPDATAVMGDFSKYLIGLRQSPVVEVTTEGGQSFEEHAVYVKVTWRGSFVLSDPTAFTLLTAIA